MKRQAKPDFAVQAFMDWFAKKHPNTKFKCKRDKVKGVFILCEDGTIYYFTDYYAEQQHLP